MTARLLSILIGYFCGCFLTAELVARKFAGKKAAEVGETGNPGMANIMAALGFVPGILVLLGDIFKCILAVVVCRLLFRESGSIVTLYAGLGCTLGHDFPFWRKFRGGKGVATSSAAITLYTPLWSLIAHLFGILLTFTTKYLCLAGVIIPIVYGVCMLILHDFRRFHPACRPLPRLVDPGHPQGNDLQNRRLGRAEEEARPEEGRGSKGALTVHA